MTTDKIREAAEAYASAKLDEILKYNQDGSGSIYDHSKSSFFDGAESLLPEVEALRKEVERIKKHDFYDGEGFCTQCHFLDQVGGMDCICADCSRKNQEQGDNFNKLMNKGEL